MIDLCVPNKYVTTSRVGFVGESSLCDNELALPPVAGAWAPPGPGLRNYEEVTSHRHT